MVGLVENYWQQITGELERWRQPLAVELCHYQAGYSPRGLDAKIYI